MSESVAPGGKWDTQDRIAHFTKGRAAISVYVSRADGHAEFQASVKFPANEAPRVATEAVMRAVSAELVRMAGVIEAAMKEQA